MQTAVTAKRVICQNLLHPDKVQHSEIQPNIYGAGNNLIDPLLLITSAVTYWYYFLQASSWVFVLVNNFCRGNSNFLTTQIHMATLYFLCVDTCSSDSVY
jgi:hypothetical protein